MAGGASRGIVLYSPVFVGGEKFEAAPKDGQLEVALIKVPKTFGCTMRSAQGTAGLAPLAILAQATTTCGPTQLHFRPALGAWDWGRRRQQSKITSGDFVLRDKSLTLEAAE